MAFAHRLPLPMACTPIPSPDATSAFLVCSFAGAAAFAPGGVIVVEFVIDLTGDPSRPRLRRPDGASAETATLYVLNPGGSAWPLPPGPADPPDAPSPGVPGGGS